MNSTYGLWLANPLDIILISVAIGVFTDTPANIAFEDLIRMKNLEKYKSLISSNKALQIVCAISSLFTSYRLALTSYGILDALLGNQIESILTKTKQQLLDKLKQSKKIENPKLKCIIEKFIQVALTKDALKLSIEQAFIQSSYYKALKLGFAKAFIATSTLQSVLSTVLKTELPVDNVQPGLLERLLNAFSTLKDNLNDYLERIAKIHPIFAKVISKIKGETFADKIKNFIFGKINAVIAPAKEIYVKLKEFPQKLKNKQYQLLLRNNLITTFVSKVVQFVLGKIFGDRGKILIAATTSTLVILASQAMLTCFMQKSNG